MVEPITSGMAIGTGLISNPEITANMIGLSFQPSFSVSGKVSAFTRKRFDKDGIGGEDLRNRIGFNERIIEAVRHGRYTVIEPSNFFGWGASDKRDARRENIAPVGCRVLEIEKNRPKTDPAKRTHILSAKPTKIDESRLSRIAKKELEFNPNSLTEVIWPTNPPFPLETKHGTLLKMARYMDRRGRKQLVVALKREGSEVYREFHEEEEGYRDMLLASERILRWPHESASIRDFSIRKR